MTIAEVGAAEVRIVWPIASVGRSKWSVILRLHSVDLDFT